MGEWDVVSQTPIDDSYIGNMVRDAAKRYNVDPDLALRVASAESAFDPIAVSPKGAIGVMQLMPGTAKDMGVDPHIVNQNIDGGVKRLSQMLTRYDGDQTKALAAYNAGPGAVDKYNGVPPYKETRDYVAKILPSGDPWAVVSQEPMEASDPWAVVSQEPMSPASPKHTPAGPAHIGDVPILTEDPSIQQMPQGMKGAVIGAKNIRPPSAVITEPDDKWLDKLLIPLDAIKPDPEKYTSPPAQMAAAFMRRVVREAEGLSSPRNAAILGGLTVGSKIPYAGPVISFLAGAVFSYDMAKSMIEETTNLDLRKAWEDKDYIKIGDYIGAMFAQGTMLKGIVTHAGKGPLESRLFTPVERASIASGKALKADKQLPTTLVKLNETQYTPNTPAELRGDELFRSTAEELVALDRTVPSPEVSAELARRKAALEPAAQETLTPEENWLLVETDPRIMEARRAQAAPPPETPVARPVPPVEEIPVRQPEVAVAPAQATVEPPVEQIPAETALLKPREEVIAEQPSKTGAALDTTPKPAAPVQEAIAPAEEVPQGRMPMKVTELPDYAQGAIHDDSMMRRTNEGGGMSAPDPYDGIEWEKTTVSIDSLKPRNESLWGPFRTSWGGSEYVGSRTKGPIVVNDRGDIIDGTHRTWEAVHRGDKDIDVFRPLGKGEVATESPTAPAPTVKESVTVAPEAARVPEVAAPSAVSAGGGAQLVPELSKYRESDAGYEQWQKDIHNASLSAYRNKAPFVPSDLTGLTESQMNDLKFATEEASRWHPRVQPGGDQVFTSPKQRESMQWWEPQVKAIKDEIWRRGEPTREAGRKANAEKARSADRAKLERSLTVRPQNPTVAEVNRFALAEKSTIPEGYKVSRYANGNRLLTSPGRQSIVQTFDSRAWQWNDEFTGPAVRASEMFKEYSENPIAQEYLNEEGEYIRGAWSAKHPGLKSSPTPAVESVAVAAPAPLPPVESAAVDLMKPPVTLPDVVVEFPTPVAKAKTRLKTRFTELAKDETGEMRLKWDTQSFNDLVTVGADYMRTVGTKFGEWSQAMIAEFGAAIRPMLYKAYHAAKNFDLGSERGSLSTKPAEGELLRSPNYDRKSEPKLGIRLNVSPETEALFMEKSAKYKAETPSRVRPWDEIRARAADVGAEEVLSYERPKEGKGLLDHEYLAGTDVLGGLLGESVRLSKERFNISKESQPELAQELTDKINRLDADANRLIGVLAAEGTKRGQALNALKIKAKQSWDAAYWTLYAKRSMGLPTDVDLPLDVQQKVGAILAKGADAQREAEARVLATPGAPKRSVPSERVPTEAQRRTAMALGADRAKLVEDAVQRRLAAIKAEQAGEVKTPGPRALTPEERSRVQSDPRVVAARTELIRAIQKLEFDHPVTTLVKFGKSMMLTGLNTQEVNFSSNAILQPLKELERVPASLVSIAIAMHTNRVTVQGPNLSAMGRAIKAGTQKGLPRAMEVLKTGASTQDLQKGDIHRESNADPRWFPGRSKSIVDTVINVPFRVLAAADKPFYEGAANRSISEQAYLIAENEVRSKTIPKSARDIREQELRDHPTTVMQAEAAAYGLDQVFNKRNELAQTLISEPARKLERLGGGYRAIAVGMHATVPYANVPANVAQAMFDRLPIVAGTRLGYHLWTALRKGMTDATARSISWNVANGMSGAAMIYLGALAYQKGIATPAWRPNPAERSTEEASKIPSGSVNVGGRWHQIARIAPHGTLFTLGATLMAEGERPLRDAFTRIDKLVQAGASSLMEHPMLQGLRDLAEVIKGSGLDYFAGRKVSMLVPAISNQIGAAMDPVRRETRPETKGVMAIPEAVGKAVAAKIPVLRETLPEKKDVFGRVLEQEKLPLVYFGIGAKDNTAAVEHELRRNRVGVAKTNPAPKEVPAVFRARRDVVGNLLYQSLRETLDSSDYQDLPQRGTTQDESRKLALDKAVAHARQRVTKVTSSKEYREATNSERIALLRELTN